MGTRSTISTILVATAAATSFAAPAMAITGQQALTADVLATLEATFPSGTVPLSIAVGTPGETSSQVVTVKSNKAWGVKIAAHTDMPGGRMRLSNSTTNALIGSTALTHPLEWRLESLGGAAQATSYADLSTTAAAVTSNRPLTSDSGVAVSLLYQQRMSYGDAPPSAGEVYRIVVVYDAAQGY